MTPKVEQFHLRRWRSQWAHVPLTFAPMAVAFPLLLVSLGLEQAGYPQVAQAVGMAGGLGFMAAVLAMPLLWRRWRRRGSLELQFRGSEATLMQGDGTVVATANLGQGRARFGVFEYKVTHRYAGGTYRSPLVELAFPGHRVTIGGEGVGAPAGHASPEAKPQFVVVAADWQRLVSVLD